MANKIHLKGNGRYEEAVVHAAFYPGHLLTVNSDGEITKHATEGGYSERAFAVEDALQGNTVDTVSVAGNTHPYVLALPGDEVNAFIKAGENVAVGDMLISGGDGTLIANGSESSGTTVRQIIAIAMAANDLTGSGAVATKSAVRVV